MNKKNKKTKKRVRENFFSEEGLSSIGEAFRKLDPDMAIRLKALQMVESPAEWVMDVIFDLFPYAWKDTELLGDAILNIFACEFEEAVEALKGAIRMCPDAYPAYHLLGHVYGCMGNFKDDSPEGWGEVHHTTKDIRVWGQWRYNNKYEFVLAAYPAFKKKADGTFVILYEEDVE